MRTHTHAPGAVFNLSINRSNAAARRIVVLPIVIAIVASANLTNAKSVQDTPGDESAAILAAARKIFVRSRTVYMKPEELESALSEEPEFKQLGLVITRDVLEADLIIEVDRAVLAEVDRAIFTLEFPFKVFVPGTNIVVVTGQVSSIGGTVAGKIASNLIKQIKAVR